MALHLSFCQHIRPLPAVWSVHGDGNSILGTPVVTTSTGKYATTPGGDITFIIYVPDGEESAIEILYGDGYMHSNCSEYGDTVERTHMYREEGNYTVKVSRPGCTFTLTER